MTDTLPKRVDLLRTVLTYKQLCEQACTQLQQYIYHSFVARWMAAQFKACKANLQRHQLLIVMDFSMNLVLSLPREVQAMWFFNKTMTLLMLITYHLDPDTGKLVKIVHAIFSDVKQHDQLFVEAALDMIAKRLGAALFDRFTEVYMWTDGCASQFKCKEVFKLRALRSGSKEGSSSSDSSVWNKVIFQYSFCTSHGKGDHDGQGAVIKRHLALAIVRGADGVPVELNNAEDCMKECSKHLQFQKAVSCQSQAARCHLARREFYALDAAAISKFTKPKMRQVKDTQKLHAARYDCDPDVMSTRELGCCWQEVWPLWTELVQGQVLVVSSVSKENVIYSLSPAIVTFNSATVATVKVAVEVQQQGRGRPAAGSTVRYVLNHHEHATLVDEVFTSNS
ncbi:MAG: hypothetical protein WDW38_008801 [Sanguina aurantia]